MDECSVCWTEIVSDMVLSGTKACTTVCGHTYHRTCLRTWLKQHQTCPMCRHVIANQCHDCDAQEAPEAEVYQVDVQDGGVEMYVPVYVPVYDEDTPSEREVNEQDSEPEPEPEGDSDYVMSSGSDTDDE